MMERKKTPRRKAASDSAEMTRVKTPHVRWMLVVYDSIIYVCAYVLVLILAGYVDGNTRRVFLETLPNALMLLACWLTLRFITRCYRQIWRYGGIQSYLFLVLSDSGAFLLFTLVAFIARTFQGRFLFFLTLYALNLLGSLLIRMLYLYAYRNAAENRFANWLLGIFAGREIARKNQTLQPITKIKIAIVGAGRVGAALAEELQLNRLAYYEPVVFIDDDPEKIGGQIYGLPVLDNSNATVASLGDYDVQEIVFAIPQLDAEKQKTLYEKYTAAGYKIKVYDYPSMQTAGKKVLRDFDPEELLFRKPVVMQSEKTRAFYKDKTILITGGGGSIGSEICRQLAKMKPKKLIILDICENGAYDIQQEIKIANPALDTCIEIVSICNENALERVYQTYKPEIVVMAAAHKHVPLMEHNCIEAIENNVFGTLNTVQLGIKYGAKRIIMVSTDKAVNPANIMGATKRICEMIVRAYASVPASTTTFSATRFGNVLGSAGSVIPLFKRQIAAGGPITITDKRIIRYFMTIPEASQLVLESGAMAQNGELFVLDMGQPVKILDLAEGMIRLSGMEPGVDIQIVETGLRPGEKLYEELLVRSSELGKTENELIFTERDTALNMDDLNQRLDVLRKAVAIGDETAARAALHAVVPTYIETKDK